MKDREKIRKILKILNSEKSETEEVIDIFLSLFEVILFPELTAWSDDKKKFNIYVKTKHGVLSNYITKEQYVILDKWWKERNTKND